MDFIKEIAISVGSSLLSAFAMWLVSRWRPVRNWISGHLVPSSLIGMLIIYIAGFATLAYLLISVRNENIEHYAEFRRTLSAAKWGDKKPINPFRGNLDTPNGASCDPGYFVVGLNAWASSASGGKGDIYQLQLICGKLDVPER